MCKIKDSQGVDITFEMLGPRTSELNISGCTQFEVELTGDASLMLDDMYPISPADGKVCFQAPCGADFIKNKKLTWGEGAEKSGKFTKMIVVPRPSPREC
jgi:hypothetical protein